MYNFLRSTTTCRPQGLMLRSMSGNDEGMWPEEDTRSKGIAPEGWFCKVSVSLPLALVSAERRSFKMFTCEMYCPLPAGLTPR